MPSITVHIEYTHPDVSFTVDTEMEIELDTSNVTDVVKMCVGLVLGQFLDDDERSLIVCERDAAVGFFERFLSKMDKEHRKSFDENVFEKLFIEESVLIDSNSLLDTAGCFLALDDQKKFCDIDVTDKKELSEDLADEIFEAIRENMEVTVADYEDLPNLGEALNTSDLEYMIEAMERAPSWTDEDVAGIKFMMDEFGMSPYDLLKAFKDGELSFYESVAAYGEEHLSGVGDLPSYYRAYFDFESYGNDCLLDADSTEAFGGIVVRNQ